MNQPPASHMLEQRPITWAIMRTVPGGVKEPSPGERTEPSDDVLGNSERSISDGSANVVLPTVAKTVPPR